MWNMLRTSPGREDPSSSPTSSSPGILNQFNYLGRIGQNFLGEHINGEEEEEEEEEEPDEGEWNNSDEEEEGWNEEDDNIDAMLDEDAVESGDENEVPSAAVSLSEANEADSIVATRSTEPSVGFSLSEVNDEDSIAKTRSTEPSVAFSLSEVNGDASITVSRSMEPSEPILSEEPGEELKLKTPPPSSPTANDAAALGLTPVENSVDDHIVSSHRDVAGRLDAVIQQIDEQELKNTSNNGEQEDEYASAGEMSLSDNEHEEIAVQEIQHEIELLHDHNPEELANQLVDQIPAVPSTANDNDTALAEDGASRLVENDDDEQMYGPVVDLLPKPLPMSRHDSMAVQVLMEDDDASGWKDDEEEEGEEIVLETEPETQVVPEHTVVDHTPVICHQDDTTISIGVVASVADEPETYGRVVDLTPTTPVTTTLAESMAVNASEIEKDFEDDEEMDFTSNGDSALATDSEDEDHADAATVTTEGKRTTFAPEVFAVEIPALVDHLPPELPEEDRPPVDNSVIALAATEDMTRDTNMDEEDDENEGAYGPVVDQTPETPAFSGANSCAAHAASEAESVDDDETDAAGVGGWGNEEEEAKEEDVVVVDHTPSEIESPVKRTDIASVDVVASRGTVEASITGDDNEEYGLVVDHTPTTPAASGWVRSESVVVQAHDDLGTVDETTVRETADDQTLQEEDTEDGDQVVDHIPTGQESRYGDGSTLAAADPSEVLSVVDGLAAEDFGPVVDVTPQPLVENVPVGEGSTAVFAPPSVVADDLDAEEDGVVEQEGWEDGVAPNPQCGIDEPVEEENEQLVDFLPPTNNVHNADVTREGLSDFTVGGAQSFSLQGDNQDDFGPVVDLIPSSGTSSHISLGSMATHLTPSECRAMEKDDIMHEKADETLTPESKVVVDHLPALEQKNHMDSVATNFRSLLSEEGEEEEEDATYKFCPVVDHLPTSRASLAPSRGGSTVDALATVSEVHSDEEGSAPGWPEEEEVDFDASLGGLSDVTEQAASRPKSSISQTVDPDRNVSVRFDSSVNDSKSAQDEVFHHKSAGDKGQFGNVDDDTEFHDTNVAWGDDIVMKDSSSHNFHDAQESYMDKSFSEADTPPSTPHRKSSGLRLDQQVEISLPQLDRDEEKVELSTNCNGVESSSYPGGHVQLTSNNGFGLVVGEMVTPDGDVVKIDLSKLLQDEITRRRLVEEELKALKMQNQADHSPATEEVLAEVSRLEKSNTESLQQIAEAHRENQSLLKENELLNESLCESKKSIFKLEEVTEERASNEAAFEAEVSRLKESLNGVMTSDMQKSEEGNRLAKLQIELASKDKECVTLASRISSLEKRLRTAEQSNANQAQDSASLSGVLKHNISLLREQLACSDKLVETTEVSRRELERRLNALEKEVTNLRSSKKHVAELQVQHERDLQEQYKLLDKKTADIRTLERMVSILHEEKATILSDLTRQRSLAEQSEALADELLSVAKERDLLEQSLLDSRDTMNELRRLIDEQGTQRQLFDEKRNEENAALRAELEDVRAELESKQSDFRDMASQVDSLQKERVKLETDMEEANALRDSLQDEIKQVNGIVAVERQKLITANTEIEKLKADEQEGSATIEKLNGMVAKFETEASGHTCKIASLEEKLVSLEETSSSLVTEREDLLTSRDNANKAVIEIDSKYQDALQAFEKREKGLTAKYQEDLERLNTGSKALEDEVQRLQEAEAQNAQTLEEVERNSVEESQRFDENNAQLTVECNELRVELNRLEVLEADHARSLLELDAKAKAEIEKLKQELVWSQEIKAASEQPLEELRILMREEETKHKNEIEELRALNASLQKEITERLDSNRETAEELKEIKSSKLAVEEEILFHKSEVDRLGVLCDQLQNEQSLYEQAKEELNRSLQELQSRLEEKTTTFEREICELRNEKEELQAELDRKGSASEEVKLAEARLAESTEQYELLKNENEEMLVQFGLLKHKMDDSDAFVKSLKARIAKSKADRESAEEALNSKLNLLQGSNESTVAKLNASEARLTETLDVNSKLKVAMGILEARAAELEHHTESQHADIDALKQARLEASEVKAELSQTTETLREKNNMLAESRMEVEEAQKNLEAQSKRADEIRSHFQHEEELHEQSLQEMTKRLNDLEGQLNNAREQNKSTEASLAAKSQVMTLLKESEIQIQDLEANLQSKNATISALEHDVENLEANIGSRPEDMKELEAVKAQVSVLNEALNATRDRLAAKESEMDRLSKEIRELQSSRSQDVVQTVTRELSVPLPVANESVIARAAQLRRSKSRRVDALQRLEDERKANVEALAKLRASVNRYCQSSLDI